ncbi:MAG: glutamate-5-semialdehyde dehydrogenase, partial [Candidatus Methanomethylophilaceae archaeon]|nr:glutamate-5-semialdehyde dehydrogenase [Candidatus Methanomethylophilaceae archaeon]
MSDVVDQIIKAKTASIDLSVLSTEVKDAALRAMAGALNARRSEILDANASDLERGRAMLDAGEISGSMFKRLRLDDSKIDGMIDGIMDVIALGDPVGEVMSSLDLDDGLTLHQIRCPIGMLGVIFESRPDVVPQIMSLCLKSGNAVAFKGGREALDSIRVLFDILRDAASDAGVPADAFVLMESRSDIDSILGLHEYIDLLIPRGSNEFVRYIQSHTAIPVLGHAAGVCHVYVDSAVDIPQAAKVLLDSKTQYPAVCNAAETLLVHSDVAEDFLGVAAPMLSDAGVEVRADVRSLPLIPGSIPAVEEDWDIEYGDLTISVRVVDSLSEAITHINTHGS